MTRDEAIFSVIDKVTENRVHINELVETVNKLYSMIQNNNSDIESIKGDIVKINSKFRWKRTDVN